MTTPIDRMDPSPPLPAAAPPAAPPTAFSASLRGSGVLRVGVVLAAAVVLLVSAALALGASPTPTGGSGAAPQATPGGNGANPGPRLRDRALGGGGLFGLGGGARFGFGNITVTGVDGSNVSLKTDDGWTRTITVTSSTKLTKGGNAIALGDIKAGDRIRFRETRNADGTFAIQAVDVVLPSVFGKVTAKTADSITVETAGGGTATIHVSGSTTYRVAGKANATLGDVAVGEIIGAQGEQRADGSLDATTVRAAGKPGRWFGDRGGNLNPKAAPNATPNAKPGSYTG
jgi:uncharacterized protein DUF5666